MQNNGFAIRRGLPFACGPDLTDISLDDDVRRGVELRVFPDRLRSSACFPCISSRAVRVIPWIRARRGCPELARQVPALEGWIDTQAREHSAFAVLGDFNRDLRRESPGISLWGDIDDADPPEADLVNTADGQTFQNCSPSQTFSGYIDYIVLGRRMARGLVPGLLRTSALRPAGRRTAKTVRPLPGIHPAPGGRRDRRIVVNRKREIF